MKTVFAILMFAGTLAAQTPTVTLTSVPVRVGATATVTVTMSGAGSGVAAIQWFIPAIPGQVATAGPAATLAGKSLTCGTANGLFGCIVSGINTSLITDGVLATVAIQAPAVPVSLPLTQTLAVDLAATVGIPVGAGTPLMLASLSPCDINGDGRTDLLDIRNIIDQIEGVIPGSTDLNGDGRTTLIDLQRVINAAVDGGTCRTGA